MHVSLIKLWGWQHFIKNKTAGFSLISCYKEYSDTLLNFPAYEGILRHALKDRTMKVREIVKLLKADGWSLVATKGSHKQYKHPTKPGRVTIAGHPGMICRQEH